MDKVVTPQAFLNSTVLGYTVLLADGAIRALAHGTLSPQADFTQ